SSLPSVLELPLLVLFLREIQIVLRQLLELGNELRPDARREAAAGKDRSRDIGPVGTLEELLCQVFLGGQGNCVSGGWMEGDKRGQHALAWQSAAGTTTTRR